MSFLTVIPGEEPSDQELVIRYKQTSDLQVLALLYQRYMDLVYGVCLKYFRDPEESKDAVMNIFEELVKKLKMHEVGNFRGWLHVVAKNHCLMQLRKKNRFRTSEIDPSLVQSLEDMHHNGVMEREESLQIMEDCMGTLPAEQKRSVELFYLQNKCYREISEITGLEWNLVRSQIQNGKRNLRICMEKKQQNNQTNL
jgi:RNA polymerase sigma factor (sigma-70 family)